MDKEKKNCLIYCRVSTPKQSQEGESLETQNPVCRNIADSLGADVLGSWDDACTGRKDDRAGFKEMMEFIKNYPGKIDYLIFRVIDRFTRGGAAEYDRLKKKIAKYGIQLVDSYKIIQPPENTLEHTGFEYDWSIFHPSGMTEMIIAENSRNEVTTILTRLIGAEIDRIKEGYQIGVPDDGYVNEKIFVDGKKKTIQVPDSARAKYYVEMFELRASGLYGDKEIVDRINAMGFKTKKRKRWDRLHQNIIGYTGEVPLTVKQLQRIAQKPIYCAVRCEKWTHFQPLRQKYDGLVSIETFNKANRGKVFIKEYDDGNLQILYNQNTERAIKRRSKNNPLYPYKNIILCPYCKKPFLASAPQNKAGKNIPRYHCARKHRYFSVNKTKFENDIQGYIKGLRFKGEFVEKLEKVLIKTWRKKQKKLLANSQDINKNLCDLESEKEKTITTLVNTENPAIKEELEKRIELLGEKIKDTQTHRNKLEVSEENVQSFIKYTRYLMEHLEELLLDTKNLNRLRALFGLVFEEMPTYEEIVNGTPKLSLVFELSEGYKLEKSQLVAPRGIEPRLPG
jgi:site-specific DNA recombinase